MRDESTLIDGISNEEYHADPAISSSQLKYALKCPAYYKAHIDGKLPHTNSPAMQLGTVLHAMVLEPETVIDVAMQAPTFKGKGSVAARAEFKAENAGKILLSGDDWQRVEDMAGSVLAEPDVADILAESQNELSGWYDDPDTGLRCRYRPDARVPWACLDLKSAADASPIGFSRAIESFGYHISAAHYLIGEQEVSGIDHETFCFLVVENTAPYLAASYVLDAESLALGYWLRWKALKLIKECTESGNWPGYNAGQSMSLGVPNWSPAMRKFNEGE